MKPRELPSIERLREILRLDPETGKLYFRVRRSNRAAGTEAFTCPTTGGCDYIYMTGRIDGRLYTRARVVFALTHGRWPVGEVRHLDGDSVNDRPENLVEPASDPRGVARQWNPTSTKRTSRFMGVTLKPWGTWQARRRIAGKVRHLGCFPTEEAAAEAYDNAAHLTGSDFANRTELRNFEVSA